MPSGGARGPAGRSSSDWVGCGSTCRSRPRRSAPPQALLDRGIRPGGAGGETDWHALSTEARAGAAEAVRRLISDARLLSGPADLAMDAGLAHAVPDLELYVLQQNS